MSILPRRDQMANEKNVWKNGTMEHWNIGLRKKAFLLLNIIPPFQHSNIPELSLSEFKL